MKVLKNVALAAVLLPLAVAPLSAQRWKVDFGINGGYSWMSNFLKAENTGLADDAPGSHVKFDDGWLLGTQLGYWFGNNFGIRANGRYADRSVNGSDIDNFSFISSVNLWALTGDLMFRFVAPKDEFSGMEFLPYLAAGAGWRWQNPGGDQFTCNDNVENEQFNCGPLTTGLPGSPRTFALDEDSYVTGLVGLGADWRISRNFAIRTEVNDLIYKPKVYLATQQGTTNTYDLTNGEENVAKVVHEIGGQIGLQFLFGVPRPTAVAVAPPPPTPAPEPQPQPTPPPPPPPPAEESITVCVIDPTAAGGIRMENAVFIPSAGDTMITVNGQRVELNTTLGSVMTASSADWYVRGAPLELTVGNQKIQFQTTGTPQVVAATDLAFLGTVNGVPVYADRDDVQDIQEELNELNRAQRGADLAKLMEEHRDLREDLNDVKTFYVAMQPTGCVFQTLTRVEAVRKNK
jgi:hypothetical protein